MEEGMRAKYRVEARGPGRTLSRLDAEDSQSLCRAPKRLGVRRQENV